MDEAALGEHYGSGIERERVQGGSSRIEFERTKELLSRFLPPPPAQILDVGGGPGTYAVWLSELGYDVHLIDPVALHIEQAAEASEAATRPFTVSLGEARELEARDASRDVVLLLGPLYHLTERSDRVRALLEARRVVRPGGLVAAAAISRFASLLDGLRSGWLGGETFRKIVDRDLTDGQHRNPTDREEWFTTAFFHHPTELREELEEAGLEIEGMFGVEGPAWLLPDLWDDPENREEVLYAARAVEREPTLSGMSAHMLVVTRRAG